MPANANDLYAGLGQDLVTGTWNSGPEGTTLPPTDTTFFDAVLDAGLSDAGYIGESGVAISQGRSFTDIKDMDGNAIDTIQTDANGTIKLTFMELNRNNLESLFGEENVEWSASTLSHGERIAAAVALGEDLDPRVHVGRMKSGKKRAGLIVPKGRYTDVGDITFNNSGAASVDVTVKCIPVYDAVREKNVDFYLFLDNGVYAVSLVPVISTVLPSGQAATESVAIEGSRFTGATVVKFGATNATSFEVVHDNLITAVLPVGSAGSAPVTVTNGSGISAAKAYTRA